MACAKKTDRTSVRSGCVCKHVLPRHRRVPSPSHFSYYCSGQVIIALGPGFMDFSALPKRDPAGHALLMHRSRLQRLVARGRAVLLQIWCENALNAADALLDACTQYTLHPRMHICCPQVIRMIDKARGGYIFFYYLATCGPTWLLRILRERTEVRLWCFLKTFPNNVLRSPRFLAQSNIKILPG